MAQTFHYNVDRRIHHTSDHQEHMALLRHACQCLHVATEQSEQKSQRYNFAGLKTLRDQRPKQKIKVN